jgi:hypothetical protein
MPLPNRPRKDYGKVKGGPDEKPEKPKGPLCPVCGQEGKYTFGTMIICATKHRSDNKTCDERGSAPPDDTEDDLTPVPHWYGRWGNYP